MRPRLWGRAACACLAALGMACGDSVLTGSEGADATPGVGNDAIVDGGSLVVPEGLAPCQETNCWETEIAIPLCSSQEIAEDFSSGQYGAHRYRAVLWGQTPIRIGLTSTDGEWMPVLVINDVDGRTLYDGRNGLQSEDVTVRMDGTGNYEVVLNASHSMGVDLIVADARFLDGDSGVVSQDAGYVLSMSGDCGVPAMSCVVNGYAVPEPACNWLHFTARRVIPDMIGTREENIENAARVAWWALKEGVLYLQNPIVYSNCSVSGVGDTHVGPFYVCQPNRAWQVGLAGMQAAYLSTSAVEDTASLLYPDKSGDELLALAAAEAGLPQQDVAQIVAGDSALRRSWLLRDSAIGFHHQAPIVTRECINDSKSWCFGSGWSSTVKFAPSRSGAMNSIADIEAMFEGLAP